MRFGRIPGKGGPGLGNQNPGRRDQLLLPFKERTYWGSSIGGSTQEGKAIWQKGLGLKGGRNFPHLTQLLIQDSGKLGRHCLPEFGKFSLGQKHYSPSLPRKDYSRRKTLFQLETFKGGMAWKSLTFGRRLITGLARLIYQVPCIF